MTFRQISDMVQHKNPVTAPEAATVKEACQRMRDRHVGAVLVIGRGHRLAGIFTGRDAVTRVLAEGRDPSTTKLADVMTPKPCTMSRTQSSVEALRLMNDGGYRHLPIVDDNGTLLSVISRGDFRGLEQARLDEETGLWERL